MQQPLLKSKSHANLKTDRSTQSKTDLSRSLGEMDLEIQQIESALSQLRQQLKICTKDIQNLTALRHQVSQDPRSVLKSITKGQIPKPLSIQSIPTPKSCTSPAKRCVPKRTITPSSPLSELPVAAAVGENSLRKIAISKARKLPGYRLVTRTNLEFAKEWKDQEEEEESKSGNSCAIIT